MICLLSLIVFSFMGIFSASHRELAKEAFNCVTDKARGKPCESDLEDAVKAGVVGRLLDYHPGTARFVKKHFELLSWISLVIILATGIYSGISIYNLFVYGHCGGPQAVTGCTINAGGSALQSFIDTCISIAEVFGF